MKLLTNILLILNPISGFIMLASVMKGGLYFLLIPFLILLVVMNFKLYFRYHNQSSDREGKIDKILNNRK